MGLTTVAGSKTAKSIVKVALQPISRGLARPDPSSIQGVS